MDKNCPIYYNNTTLYGRFHTGTVHPAWSDKPKEYRMCHFDTKIRVDLI
jgi:hypothetical protein